LVIKRDWLSKYFDSDIVGRFTTNIKCFLLIIDVILT